MSVLCCYIPDFLMTLAQLHDADPDAPQPLALLGPDERICAASGAARAAGIHLEMGARRALARCPDLRLAPCDVGTAQDVQAALLSVLHAWALPVETLSWGAAYVDLQAAASGRADAQLLAAELGGRVRQELGTRLQPSLGWDSGKFTARAAALRVPAGRMRLVDKPQEIAFLAALPITLLPLPPTALAQLHWLGIATLGQFGKLPASAVQQRFGQAGRLAQQWAQGRDDRPVNPSLTAPPQMLEVAMDPPTGLLAPLLEGMAAALQPVLLDLDGSLRGITRLRITLHFVMGETRTLDLVTVTPVSQMAQLHALLHARLRALSWPGEVSAAQIVVTATAELPLRQIALLPALDMASGSTDTVTENVMEKATEEVARSLAARYGAIFFQTQVSDERHPVAMRRTAMHGVP